VTAAPTAIIHLIGYPGAGKPTIGRACAATAAARGHHLVVVDNHLTGDPVLRVVAGPDVPAGAWQLVYEVREVVHRAIRELSPPGWSFLFTNVLWDDDEGDRGAVTRLRSLAAERGSRYQVVMVDCAPDELLRRVPSEGRREQLKLVDVDIVRHFLDTRRLHRPPVGDVLDLDVTDLDPSAAAARILDCAGLR
jgi:hypothetical protein